ncbi:hypothetical protein CTI12_AA039040 [Artemisia annua]|uniref:proteasome endopeptidase complex n=1 Tax=Artemisia annua TaxID=35608 RepID=A0A2U1QF00_ARTAN|nr:hypothetical protein CTI12_AA039040 [Artemisia annua]
MFLPDLMKGPGLYYVDSEGGRLKVTKFYVGSGSPYAYGVLDSGYRYDMTVDEATELARRSIYHATFRDGASGGVASNLYALLWFHSGFKLRRKDMKKLK